MTLKWGFAQVDQQWFTTTAQLADAQRMYTEVQTLHPQYWRIGAAWSLIARQKDPGTVIAGTPPTSTGRDWSTVDTALNDALLMGVDVVLILGVYRPSWGGWWFGIGATPGTVADFAAHCAEVATRYKPGGVGIRTDGKYASNAGKGVRIFEVWNEQNDQNHWFGQISAKDYTDYLKAAYTAVKSVTGLTGTPAPGVAPTTGQSMVLFGGTYHVQRIGPWLGYGIASLPEIDFVIQCYGYGAHGYFDAMAVHFYPHLDASDFNGASKGPVPSTNLDGWRQLTEIRGVMVDNGDSALKIWVTEAGFPVSIVTEAQQNTYWQSLWAMFSTLPYVETVFFYCARDGGGDVTSINGSLGAMRADFTHRPVWDWLATLSALSPSTAAAAAAVGNPSIAAAPVPLEPTTATATAALEALTVPSFVNPTTATASASVATPALTTKIAPTTATAAAAVGNPTLKIAYTLTMPASTLPTGWSTMYGDTATVSGSIMREGTHTGANGKYRTVVGNTAPTNTNRQYCKCVMGTDTQAADRGQGPGVAFDSAYTNGVFGLGTGFTFGDAGIYSKVGGVITLEAAWTGNAISDTALEIRMTSSGAHAVYTLYLDGVSTVVSWTDSTDKVVPGKYCGVVFQTSMVFGVQYRSMGVKGPINYGDM